MDTKKSWANRVLDRMYLPGESIPRQTILELCGDGRIMIENHSGVTVYTACRIQVRVSFGEVAVVGAHLQLCMMRHQQLYIRGKIEEILIIREG